MCSICNGCFRRNFIILIAVGLAAFWIAASIVLHHMGAL